MKVLIIFTLSASLLSTFSYAQVNTGSSTETFNPQTAAADLAEIRRHISNLESKIVVYQLIGSGLSQFTGVVVCAMGALDLYSVLSASDADLFVMRQAERMEQGAIGVGLKAVQRGGRLGAYVSLPTKFAKKFSDLSIMIFEEGSNLLILNSKIVSGGVAAAGASWYFFSMAMIPYLIRYNTIELNMLRAYAASIATEQENLNTPEKK